MGSVSFDGQGPFDLPLARSARAYAQDSQVVLSFRVSVDPSREETVRIAVLRNQARELATQIFQAADETKREG